MGKGGRGCVADVVETDLDDLTCRCGCGYMNEEGTFIPGSLVRSGQALSEDRYMSHRQTCKSCEKHAPACRDREILLLRSAPRDLEPHELGNYVQFFFPSEGIESRVLEDFIALNGGPESSVLFGKRFKGKSGYFITSRFRFDSRDRNQLRELSLRVHRGEQLAERSLERRLHHSPETFTEFTRYLDQDTVTKPAAPSQSAPRHRTTSITSSQNRSQEPTDAHDARHRSNIHDTNTDDQLEELAVSTRRISISDQTRRDSSHQYDSRRSRSRDVQYAADASAHGRHQSRDDLSRPEVSRHGSSQRADLAPKEADYSSPHHGRPSHDYTAQERRPQQVIRRESFAQEQDRQTPSEGRPIRPEHSRHSSSRHDPRELPTDTQTSERRTSEPSMTQPISRSKRRQTSREEDSEAADDEGVTFFIPSDDIDLVVLASYLKFFADEHATIRKAKHPRKEGITGFEIHAKKAISTDQLRDIMADTKRWEREQALRKLRREPCSYNDSDTLRDRRKAKRKPR